MTTPYDNNELRNINMSRPGYQPPISNFSIQNSVNNNFSNNPQCFMIDKDQMRENMSQFLQSRPKREELVNREILNVQDEEKTRMIKKYLSEHLVNRPGPLDVYQHLVDKDDSSASKKGELLTTYQRAKTMLMCKTGALSNSLGVTVNRNTFEAVPRNVPKIKSLKFHEFVPGKSGANGKFVRRKWSGSRDAINSFSHLDHYRQLVEQQALFLQMEVAEKQNINNPMMSWSNSEDIKPLYYHSVQNTEYQNSHTPYTAETSEYSPQSLPSDFLNSDFNSMNDIDNYNPQNVLVHNDRDNPIKLNDDLFDDFSSSGYGTSIIPSDSFDTDDGHNLGFGLYYDCDNFNSVMEKIAFYERLHKIQNFSL
ncbi:hypothetical protein RF11_00029 [Thelohanellus kitauei]|uniref:Uncharacterized protein n=1 Tax=Thelohanellus kitauei TaxID=669202 RepID=A0A0C2NCN1_THEKT|nr:hypothetical protein RF11_00029 [Thelohanellus kitauei]